MNDIKVTLSVDPADEYQKAKKDLIQAMDSLRRLSPVQQRHLAEEFFGAANVAGLYSIMQQYMR